MHIPEIKIQDTQILSDNWYILNKVTFDFKKNDNSWITQKEKSMTAEMELPSYFIIKKRKLLF